MKLLFDQNLPPRLVDTLGDIFPGSRHVRDVALARARDIEIWQYAQDRDFCIVSKDSDFQQLSFLLGAPPKVIWLRMGNCSVEDVERVLRSNVETVEKFRAHDEAAYLILS